jgi:four helix bundle protein
MAYTEMPIFTRTFDFLAWLLPVTNNFPRAHRHTLTHRLLNAAFNFSERIEEANLRRGQARRDRLNLADEALSKVRYYLRLSSRLGWLSSGQYRHVSAMTTEIGKLLGGWIKAAR